jgi:hypothetical protein
MKQKLFVWLCLSFLCCPSAPAQQPAAPSSQEPSRASAPPPATLTIPEGTAIQLSLREPLSSKLSEVGDEVIAAVKRDVVVDGQVLLRQGTEVLGRVTLAKPARAPLKGGMLHVSFDRVRFDDGIEHKLSATIQSASDFTRDEKVKSDAEGTLKGGKSGGQILQNAGTAAAVGGAAATVIILASADSDSAGFGRLSGPGAKAGAAVLGASVVAGVLLTKGKEVRLDKDAVIRLKLERPLAVE